METHLYRVKIELGVGTKKTMGDKRDGEMKREVHI
jgi:tmRNA-binding protein